jgi:DNA invertase Pin-like site-specific DNA recombinase
VATFEDPGISGAKGRDKRPGFDRLMVAVARRQIDMFAVWSVDRLGRSLTDLLSFLTDLHAKHIDLFLHQQGLDTSTASGRAMFQMLGVFAEFERAMIRERVMAGLARARADRKQLGRRTVEQSHAKKVKAALALRSSRMSMKGESMCSATRTAVTWPSTLLPPHRAWLRQALLRRPPGRRSALWPAI